MKRRYLNRVYPAYLILPAVLVYGVFYVLPTLAGVYVSFFDWTVFTKKLSFVGLQNYAYLFRESNFVAAFRNTMSFAVVTTVLKTLVGFLLAVALNNRLFSRNVLRAVFYLPAVLSNIIVGIIFSSILKYSGLLNNLFSSIGLQGWTVDWLGNPNLALFSCMIAEVWKWSGLTMAIFLAGLQTIPTTFYEASDLDGASRFQRLRHITVPLLMPAISINVTLGIIGGLKVFDLVYVLTGGGPGHASQVINTMIIETYSQGLYGRSNAMGIILILFITAIAVPVYTLLRRREVEL
jgi:raffinose/stachyose/melibiose transport system permease protein